VTPMRISHRFAHRALLCLALCAAATACNKTAPDAAGPSPGASAGTSATASTGAPAAAGDAYERASRGHGFSVGPMMASQVVYVYFDPACPHCAHLWSATQPLQTKLRMVWVPVGFLRPQSVGQGATILAAADPSAAMRLNEASVLERGPGIPIDPAVPAEVQDRVKANTEILKQMGAESVPFIVFKHAKTGQAGTYAGALPTDEFVRLIGL
jgi:thiol:disulfide interchange protein DsbG